MEKNCHHPPRTRLSDGSQVAEKHFTDNNFSDSHPSFTPGQGWQTCRHTHVDKQPTIHKYVSTVLELADMLAADKKKMR